MTNAGIVELVVVVALIGYVQGAFREKTILSSLSLPYVRLNRAARWFRWQPRVAWLRVLSLPNIPLSLALWIVFGAAALLTMPLSTVVAHILIVVAIGNMLAYVHTMAAGAGSRRAGRKVIVISKDRRS